MITFLIIWNIVLTLWLIKVTIGLQSVIHWFHTNAPLLREMWTSHKSQKLADKVFSK